MRNIFNKNEGIRGYMTYYFRGQVSKATGLNIETLRFYEKNGLIPVPMRTDAGYRLYSEDTLSRLEFIKHAKNSGFTLDEIRNLLLIIDNNMVDYQDIPNMIDKKVNNLDQKIAGLSETKALLLKVKDNFHNPNKCPVLQEVLREK